MHRQIISPTSAARYAPIAEVIDQYLAKSDSLMRLTAEGRAFEGAFALLRDEVLLADLRRDLDIILTHPFAQALTPTEQREFRRTVKVIQDGIRDVLAQRQRLSATLRDHIVHYDTVRDRELDTTLRQINQQLDVWMRTAARGPPLVSSSCPRRSTSSTCGNDSGIPPRQRRPRRWKTCQYPPHTHPGWTISASQGGPALARLREQLIAAAAVGEPRQRGRSVRRTPGRPATARGAGRADPPAPRRTQPANPSANSLTLELSRPLPEREEHVKAIRPDGTCRAFAMPVLSLRPDDASALAEGVSS